MTQFPKVLIAGNQVPHLHTPSAILLFRLFQDWPSDRLVALGPDYHAEAQRLPGRYITWEPRWHRLEHTRFHLAARSLRTAGVLPLDSPGRLAGYLDGFQPEVVVSLMEFQHYYVPALALARWLRRPSVLMVHDLPELFESHSPLVDWFHDRKARHAYRAATEVLPISLPMEEELYRRWQRRGVVFPPLPSDDQPVGTLAAKRHDGSFTVGYAGSLDSRYGNLLRAFAEVIEGSRISLNLYAPATPRWAGTSQNTSYRGHFRPAELWDLVVSECDAVLLPYQANNDRDRLMIEFSFPSKLPEYLRLGLPVVLAVPEKSAAAAWARAHPDAFVVTANHAQSILAACHELRSNQAGARAAGVAARRLYDAEFNPRELRERFRRLLVRLAGSETFATGIRP